MNYLDECIKRFKTEKEYLGNNKPINHIHPIVSVTVATYQHNNYIEKCLDGILMQIVDFPIEVIIGEDGSEDGTREICIKYAESYPDKIRLFLRDRNTSHMYDNDGHLVMRFNGIWNRMSSRGKYIAWCEGDDYWVDPYKLTKQVNFLEKNIDYGAAFTDAHHFNQKTGTFIFDYDKSFKRTIPTGNVIHKLKYGNPYKSCTCLFRSEFLEKIHYYTLNNNVRISDRIIWLIISKYSKIGYLFQTTSVYRILEESASNSLNINHHVLFNKGGYKTSLRFSELLNLHINKNKLRRIYIKRIINICIAKNNYNTILKFYNNPTLIILILIKEKIIRKIFQYYLRCARFLYSQF
ncbi:hypothetical protein MASR2M69_19350 [Bacteroidota bacterium]